MAEGFTYIVNQAYYGFINILLLLLAIIKWLPWLYTLISWLPWSYAYHYTLILLMGSMVIMVAYISWWWVLIIPLMGLMASMVAYISRLNHTTNGPNG